MRTARGEVVIFYVDNGCHWRLARQCAFPAAESKTLADKPPVAPRSLIQKLTSSERACYSTFCVQTFEFLKRFNDQFARRKEHCRAAGA
jgi:hypothetical protein